MKLHHLAFRCNDYKEVSLFYKNLFKLKEIFSQKKYSIWLKGSDDLVFMFEQATPGEARPESNNHELICFYAEANEKKAIINELKKKNIEIESQTEKTIYFRDPENRKIGISDFNFDEFIRNKNASR